MIQGVLFDMDGLMFGTEQLYTDGFFAAGEKLGLCVTSSLLAQLRGTGIAECRQIFNAQIPGEHYDTARRLCLEYVNHYLETKGVPVKPGLVEILSWLKAHSIPAVLATSTAREKAMKLLAMTGMSGYFQALTFGTEVAHHKPAPDIFLAAAASVNADPKHCVVLEDSHNGLRAAKAAGCIAIVVPDMDPAPDAQLGLWDHQVERLDLAIPILETML